MPTTTRLRPPPRVRFKGPVRFFDLARSFAELPEQSIVCKGHMQQVLYRRGPTTMAIYAFQAEAGLDEHRFDSEAIIHVIDGRIRVTTPASAFELTENQVLLVDPDVPHDLRAIEPTRVLMTMVSEDGS